MAPKPRLARGAKDGKGGPGRNSSSKEEDSSIANVQTVFKNKLVDLETLRNDLKVAKEAAELDLPSSEHLLARENELHRLFEEADNKYKAELKTDVAQGPNGRAKGQKGKSDESKAAKAAKEAAKNNLENFQTQSKLKNRNARHVDRKEAEARYEDFLYHQRVDHRHQRIRPLVLDKTEAMKATKEIAARPYLLDLLHPNSEWLRHLLNYYDESRTGCRPAQSRSDNPSQQGSTQSQEKGIYRAGTKMAGVRKTKAKKPTRANRDKNGEGEEGDGRGYHYRKIDGIPAEELYLWQPNARHLPCGLGQPEVSQKEPHFVLDLDLKGIETRRREIDDHIGSTPEHPTMTHSQRRAEELGAFRALETANLEIPDERSNRTEAGLFIAALETNDDWLTSYDSLGPARTAWICSNPTAYSDERSKPEFPMSRNELCESTEWLEETYGRREWHMFNKLEPPSPVESPPHPPLRDGEGGSAALETPSHGSNGTNLDRLLKDPFGIDDREWPQFQSRRIGEGPLVPYAPSDVPTSVSNLSQKNTRKRKPDVDNIEQQPLDDNNTLINPALEGSAMNMYRGIAKRLRLDKRPIPGMPEDSAGSELDSSDNARGNANAQGTAAQGTATQDIAAQDTAAIDSGEESDDSGDLFTRSYRQGFGSPGGGNATTAAPEENSDDAPEETDETNNEVES